VYAHTPHAHTHRIPKDRRKEKLEKKMPQKRYGVLIEKREKGEDMETPMPLLSFIFYNKHRHHMDSG